MIVREPVLRTQPRNALQACGQRVFQIIGEIGRASMICFGGIAQMRYVLRKRSRKEVVRQLHVCAVKSLPVVTVVAFFIGMILALQIGIELRRYNQETLIGPAVMASMLREMGPFMSGLVLAASVGAAMAALYWSCACESVYCESDCGSAYCAAWSCCWTSTKTRKKWSSWSTPR